LREAIQAIARWDLRQIITPIRTARRKNQVPDEGVVLSVLRI
jgi:hypothetical protein